ncbi:hypothetical protein FHR32_003432 [Streptosporangium album]|uniref:Uncharacterized protein n=1 Tax=Streptosporangium album TaxID=47479 RepID=A0A7W7RWB3_9ACTN|nr:hypothetical protein [Streptosporangium album]MBB4939127.1 hypothetical protein [Streptosporangium album]
MESSEFLAAKQRLMGEASPSSGADLGGMLMDFDCYLWHSPVIREVEVHRTGATNSLIAATCVSVSGRSEAEIAVGLEQVWLQDLSYRYFEAHMITLVEGRVQLDVITQIAPQDFYVTATILAETSRSYGAR